MPYFELSRWSSGLASALMIAACSSEPLTPALQPAASASPTQPINTQPSPLVAESVSFVAERFCTSDAVAKSVGLEAPTGLGFTADDVLAIAAGRHETVLHWSEREELELGPESGTQALVVEVQPRGAQARVIHPSASVIGHGLVCHDWLEIDVTIRLRSQSGALNDQFDATLYSQRADSAYMLASAAGAQLAGALNARNLAKAAADQEPAALTLALSFSDLGVSGVLTGAWPTRALDFHAASSQTIELAYVGAGRCASYAHAIELATQFQGTSPRAVLDRLAALNPLGIDWSDGTRSEASVEFVPDTAACVSRESRNVSEPGLVSYLYVPGMLRIRSADGRFDGEYHTELGIGLNAEVRIAEPSFSASAGIGASEFTTVLAAGFPRQNVDRYESVTLTLFITANPTWSGRVTLTGYQNEPLQSDNGQTAAYTPVVLEEGMFH
jgi:hypothetical protein